MEQARTVFHVDAEHGALRLSIVGIFIVTWIITFAILNALIPNDGFNILALIVSFAGTALATQRIEKVLKKNWPSGRAMHIDDQKIRLMRKQQVQTELDAAQRVNVLLWRFTIKRRSRVPKGWLMVACALEQEDLYVPVYTFMSSDEFDQMQASSHFAVLQSQKELKRDSGDMRLAGAQRRLHTAENMRWMEGAEMTSEDFRQFIRHLQEQFPQWMPSVL